LAAPFAAVFLYAWYHQFQSNLILANLRKNKEGRVVTEKHMMPVGGYFELVSSPHMFFEIVMYAAYFAILYQNISALYVCLWVLCNQTENAWLTHVWYKEQYKNYPIQRRAVFPRLF
jgi:3-oxo-5-alpha-steroid 4-dehydrogenase 3 / polyprenol reductase